MNTTTTPAAPLIEAIRSQANQLLEPLLGSSNLSGFVIAGLGNFPYYWQNSTNLQFNHETYGWISANLKANSRPIQLDSSFLNYYLEALSKVTYRLSKADNATLVTAQKAAIQYQTSMLNLWKQAYGANWGNTNPIDYILKTIATTWASPATNLTAIQQARNLNALLNQTPPSGKPILPVLAQYLNALGASVSLQNATTMNAGYLATALNALQYPSADSGAMTTDDGALHAAFAVSTAVSDILDGLDSSNSVTLDMLVTSSSSSEATVNVSGQTQFSIPYDDFFTISVSANANYFSESIATSSNKVRIEMTFTGVTLVQYTPVIFDASTGLNWYWMEPITDAIGNAGKDVSGFFFSPDPGIDFSANGPFGFLNGVAIANYPSITITVTSSQYASIEKTLSTSASVGLSFLGVSLASGSESSYKHSVSTDASTSSVTIQLDPPQQSTAGNSDDYVAWVLGAVTNYPAS